MTLPHFALRAAQSLALCLALASCAQWPHLPEPLRAPAAATAPDRLDDDAILRALRDMPQTAAPALQTQTARLLALGKRRGVVEQLQLAVLLLARSEPGDVEQAQNLLSDLQPRATDAAARSFLALLQRDVAQQLALQQARKNAQTLQKQIDQIKSLETQLQNRAR